MPELTLTINNKTYDITCDEGQEQRVLDLASYLDERMRQIARSGAAQSESHLFVLMSLMLSDEVFELQQQVADFNEHGEPGSYSSQPQIDEALVSEAIQNLSGRISELSKRIDEAA